MPSNRISSSLRSLAGLSCRATVPRPAPEHIRCMATEAPLPTTTPNTAFAPLPTFHGNSPYTQSSIPEHISPPTVLTTLHAFPTLEPTSFTSYPSSYLHLPLRRDILHRAVIFEGDATRQGTASTKWRGDVHGANKKIRPQKGTGMARLGDKKSPMLRGGGVAFGPKPRDFSSGLQRRVYDLAWRTALSYRYRKGQLIVVDGEAEISRPDASLVREIFEWNGWGKGEGRSLVVVDGPRRQLSVALEEAQEQGKVLEKEDVDVKDLLKWGRVIVEKRALDWLLKMHRSDLVTGSRVKRVVA